MQIISYLVLTSSIVLLAGCKKDKPTPPDTEPPANSQKQPSKDKRTAREEKARFSLNDYKGTQPILILFADSPDNPSYKKFNAALTADEIRRHNLVVIDVFDHQTSGAKAQIRGGRQLHEVSVSDLVDAFAVGGSKFVVVLRGQDGKTAAHHKSYVEPSEVLGKLSAK
jgi:Domain of unknown function (DUF4174)